MDKKFTIKTHCLYCGSNLFDTDSKNDETITCAKCGKENSLALLREQAENEAKQQVKKDIENQIKRIFKSKTIKLKF